MFIFIQNQPVLIRLNQQKIRIHQKPEKYESLVLKKCFVDGRKKFTYQNIVSFWQKLLKKIIFGIKNSQF